MKRPSCGARPFVYHSWPLSSYISGNLELFLFDDAQDGSGEDGGVLLLTTTVVDVSLGFRYKYGWDCSSAKVSV